MEHTLDKSCATGHLFFLRLFNFSAVLEAKDKREDVQVEEISIITLSGGILIVPHNQFVQRSMLCNGWQNLRRWVSLLEEAVEVALHW